MRLWPVLCLAVAASPAAADIVTNGSFEFGAGTEADGWEQIELPGPAGSTVVDTHREFGEDINISAYDGEYLMFFNLNAGFDSAVPGDSIIRQTTAAGSIVAGQTYDFSFASIGDGNLGSQGWYEVRWYDSDFSHGGGQQGSAIIPTGFSLGTDWALNGMSGLVAPDDADSIFIYITLRNGPFNGSDNDSWAGIDAISMTAVPAPGALALFGLAGIANRRRRG